MLKFRYWSDKRLEDETHFLEMELDVMERDLENKQDLYSEMVEELEKRYRSKL